MAVRRGDGSLISAAKLIKCLLDDKMGTKDKLKSRCHTRNCVNPKHWSWASESLTKLVEQGYKPRKYTKSEQAHHREAFDAKVEQQKNNVFGAGVWDFTDADLQTKRDMFTPDVYDALMSWRLKHPAYVKLVDNVKRIEADIKE